MFPCDEIPLNKPVNFKHSLIINLDTAIMPGSHFVALIIDLSADNKSTVTYFDSFGCDIKNKYILNYIKYYNNVYYYNTKNIQHNLSDFCRLFCLGFLANDYMINNSDKFINMFLKTNLFKNDIIIEEYLKTFYKSVI